MQLMLEKTRRTALGLVLLIGFVFAAPVQATGYTYQPVDYPGSEGNTRGWGLNNVGQMVGTAADNFVYDTKKMTFTALPLISDALPGYDGGSMLNINDNGVLVGSGFLCTDVDPGTGLCNASVSRGAILDKKGEFSTFAHPDYQNTYGRAINNNKLVAGYADTFDPITGAYESVGILYDPKGESFVSFLPSQLSPTIAQGTNNKDQTVGYYRESLSPFVRYAFLRESNGEIRLLQVNESASGRARDISDYGAIAGDFRDPNDNITKGFVVCLSGEADSVNSEGIPVQGVTVAEEDFLQVPADWVPPGLELFATIPEGIDNKGRVSGIWQAINFSTGEFYSGGFLATPDKKGACR